MKFFIGNKLSSCFILGLSLSFNAPALAADECSADWSPKRLNSGQSYVYTNTYLNGVEANPKTALSYTETLLKEKRGPSGQERTFEITFDYYDNEAQTAREATSKYKTTEYIFETAKYTFRHKHFLTLNHQKLIRKIKSDSFENIRNMLVGEAILVRAEQTIDSPRARSAFRKKVTAGKDINIVLMACSKKTYAGQPYDTRSYLLNYSADKVFENDVGTKIRTNYIKRMITLDNETGLMLEYIDYDKDSDKIRSGAALTKISSS